MQNCVILGGGKSSRMGQDKTLLPFGGFATLAHYQFDKYSKIFTNVYIACKNDKFDPPLPIITDKFSDYSPMQALHSVLSHFESGKIFIIATDMPFVKETTIKKLFDRSQNVQICVAQDEFHTHNLCGFFDTNLAQTALRLHQEGIHKVRALFDQAKFCSVKFDGFSQFSNLNNPKDYDEAVKSLKLC